MPDWWQALADHGPIMERALCAVTLTTVEPVAGSFLHAAHVGVLRQHVVAEGEARDRVRRVAPDAG